MGLGFEQAGFDILASVDHDPVLSAVHQFNHPRTSMVCGDIGAIEGDAIAKRLGHSHVDVVFGGPPCQGFSFIGKRQADDPRNELLVDFVRVATALTPRYVVMENVAGLSSQAMQPHLQEVRRRFKAAGYDTAAHKIIDASDYGVPQRRKRLFILAWKNGERPVALPSPTHSINEESELKSTPTVRMAIGDLSRSPTERSSYVRAINSLKGPLGLGYERSSRPRGVTGTELTAHSKETVARFKATSPGEEEEISRYTRLQWSGVCHTMRAGTGPDHGSFMSARPIHPGEARVITVREAARLHGYPDWFEFHTTKWHSFRGIGNSVPPPLAHCVAREIVSALGSEVALASQQADVRDHALLNMGPAAAAKHFGVDPDTLPKRKREADETPKSQARRTRDKTHSDADTPRSRRP